MKLETFFEKFETFADAPDAVEKMRELVQHLAVTGALVVQDRSDEPAVALLNRIAAYKTALAKTGKLRGPTTVVPMSPNEGIRDLPSSWTWVRLGEIVVNRDGERIPVSREERVTKAKTYDYYGASGVIDKIDGYLFDKPLLLVGEDGANLVNRSTPIAFMARGQYWVNNHAHVLDGISEDFLRYIELHINAINLESYVTGSAQPKMNQAKMNSIPIALPPLAEQKRIVAKVDELMALCDRLEAQQRERETRHAALARASLARFADAPTPANLQFLFHPSYTIPPADLRKSILTLAVQGKLVAQDPNDEPAKELLERLARELTPEQRRSQAAPLAPLPTESLQHELPESWTWARFRDAAIIASNLVKPDNFLDFTHLAPDNIEKGNGVLLPCRTVREDKVISANHRFYPGQLVYSKIRPNLAKVVVVDFEGLCSADMYPIDSLIDASFLQRYMLSESFLVQAVKTDTRVAMPKINQVELNAIAVPVPPLAEQRRIVARVEQLMALVDELETQLAASRATAMKLLEAIVAELTAASTTIQRQIQPPAAEPPVAARLPVGKSKRTPQRRAAQAIR
jgi:type I restriction enzyme, S subunit